MIERDEALKLLAISISYKLFLGVVAGINIHDF